MCDDEHDDLRDDDVMWRMPCARFVDKDKGKCRLPNTPQGGNELAARHAARSYPIVLVSAVGSMVCRRRNEFQFRV